MVLAHAATPAQLPEPDVGVELPPELVVGEEEAPPEQALTEGMPSMTMNEAGNEADGGLLALHSPLGSFEGVEEAQNLAYSEHSLGPRG